MFDVTIIGCGVIGALLARKLSQYDLRILILERENDVAMGTTKANSAIVQRSPNIGASLRCGRTVDFFRLRLP